LPEDEDDVGPRDVEPKAAGPWGMASPGPILAARHTHSRNLQPADESCTAGLVLQASGVVPVWKAWTSSVLPFASVVPGMATHASVSIHIHSSPMYLVVAGGWYMRARSVHAKMGMPAKAPSRDPR